MKIFNKMEDNEIKLGSIVRLLSKNIESGVNYAIVLYDENNKFPYIIVSLIDFEVVFACISLDEVKKYCSLVTNNAELTLK